MDNRKNLMDEFSQKFPFKSKLNLSKLVEFWKEGINDPSEQISKTAKTVYNAVKDIDVFNKTIEDPAELMNHKPALDLMMSGIFPRISWDKDLMGVMPPFNSLCFYQTPAFAKMMEIGSKNLQFYSEKELKGMIYHKTLAAFLIILEKIYGKKLDIEKSMNYRIINPETGLEQYFRVDINTAFADVEVVGKKPELTDTDINDLMRNILDIDYWKKVIPPENFLFTGMVVLEMKEITESALNSDIKQELLNQGVLHSPEHFADIEFKFASMLGIPGLRLKIGIRDEQADKLVDLVHPDERPFIKMVNCDDWDNEEELINKIHRKYEAVVFEDIHSEKLTGVDYKSMKESGMSSLMVVPLVTDKEITGVLQIAAPEANTLNALLLLKVQSVLPILSMAVIRSTEEFNNEVIRVIKEKFTAVHPTVEWRFVDAATNYLKGIKSDEYHQLEEIVFEDVYPLYGASDIRNSSVERNKAIKEDLVQQISKTRKILSETIKEKPLPIYKSLDFKLEKSLKKLKKSFNSQSELEIIELLKNEIEPIFKHLSGISGEIKKLVNNYTNKLDPMTGMIHDKRKNYEESLESINQLVYSIIEEEELKTQHIYPYYFENYKTDGVDFNIYMGQSLVKDQKFHSIYLHNLRLWQLLVMAKVTRETFKLKSKLPLPLDTTQLILVQSHPLSIRFRNDEKKFDVDGAYNIRYEIVKKRIDKAVIKDTHERLTQPGKIAIIYSNQKELEEYIDYVNYLQHLEIIDSKIEYLELEDLQGVNGLKAIRVNVKLEEDVMNNKTIENEILKMVGEINN